VHSKITTETSDNRGTTLRHINICGYMDIYGYVGYATIFSWMLNRRVAIWIRFSVWLVSGYTIYVYYKKTAQYSIQYAHVFVLVLSVTERDLMDSLSVILSSMFTV